MVRKFLDKLLLLDFRNLGLLPSLCYDTTDAKQDAIVTYHENIA
jgi:hypothetical protein